MRENRNFPRRWRQLFYLKVTKLCFFFTGVKWLYVHLAPRLRISGAIHLLPPPHAFMAWTGKPLPLHMFHVILTVNTDSCPVQL